MGEKIAQGGEAVVYDNGNKVLKAIGLDYFIQPIFALDRISLHNAYFEETEMNVLGFGRNTNKDFMVIVEQPFIHGKIMADTEIATFVEQWVLNLSILEIGPLQIRIFILAICMMKMFFILQTDIFAL